MNLGAVIVTYNPNPDILQNNILLLLKNKVKVVIVDNKSLNLDKFVHFPDILLLQEHENVGIAKALNDGVKYLANINIDWVLTLDQDSILDKNYFEEFNKLDISENVAAYYPRIIDRNKDLREQLEQSIENENEINLPIQSGAFLRLRDYFFVGGMDESLFIDGVDFDFFLEILSVGRKIVPLTKTYLYHKLGNISSKIFLGHEYYMTNHPPIRYYYNYRNMPVVLKRHKNLLSNGQAGRGFSSFFNYEYKRTIKMFLWEDHKLSKFLCMIKGFHDRKNISETREKYL